MKITNEIELKVIEYYLAPHTLQDTAFAILGHKCTKATSAILTKHAVPKHNKEVVKALREETSLAKYGVKNHIASNEVKEKSRQTVRKKYGVDNVFQASATKEQIKQTCLERYGTTHYNKTAESKEKHKTTYLAKYGVDHYNKTAEGKNKREQTCLNKYGVSWYTQTNEYKEIAKAKQKESTARQLATKRKNGTFACSSAEKRYLKVLQEIFGVEDILTQYKESRYPFLCDFYIKSIDTFIELNFTWTHGGKRFTGCAEDLEKLTLWQQKAQSSKYYRSAIETWTIRDPNKYKKAQENSLNYLTFYTQKDLDAWLAELAC
jgi:hypothetical protein